LLCPAVPQIEHLMIVPCLLIFFPTGFSCSSLFLAFFEAFLAFWHKVELEA
jgi:hypothetical protein